MCANIRIYEYILYEYMIWYDDMLHCSLDVYCILSWYYCMNLIKWWRKNTQKTMNDFYLSAFGRCLSNSDIFMMVRHNIRDIFIVHSLISIKVQCKYVPPFCAFCSIWEKQWPYHHITQVTSQSSLVQVWHASCAIEVTARTKNIKDLIVPWAHHI